MTSAFGGQRSIHLSYECAGVPRDAGFYGNSSRGANKDRALLYPWPMSEASLIPPSPAEDDYVKAVAQASPLAQLSAEDPIALFADWLREAAAKEPNDPNAMCPVHGRRRRPARRAHGPAQGRRRARVRLLHQHRERQGSRAGGKSALRPHLPLEVPAPQRAHPRRRAAGHRRRGRRLFRHPRPLRQIGAWASDQSAALPERLALEKRIAAIGLRFGLGAVPRPPHWSGYRIVPRSIEFWRDRPFRLHERLLFHRTPPGWTTARLYP